MTGPDPLTTPGQDAFAISLDPEVCGEAVMAAARASFTGEGGDHLQINPKTVEKDLAKLVLALMEFLRQLMEAQAIRRMDAGRLTEDQEEAVGLTLMRARGKIVDLAGEFGLSEEDLTLHLGPLGRLV